MNFKKIGVHGQSLGGCVANHLASIKYLDFLCADRTFCSLSALLSFGFARCLSKALHVTIEISKKKTIKKIKSENILNFNDS
jgi:hypothetical protein